ncbi:MAG: efflux RND transporter permease subunit, partial [Pseudolabrys sp.]|nr:efflux RND transporter permease subunit [Pseudolabrys sp.]
MNVSAPFIRRPIATSLLAVAVMLGGLLGYWWLPVSALPQVDFPTIQVTTQLPGANPDTVTALVTAPLERQFGQIPSLASMTSSSSFGISQVTLQFDLNRDIDAAAQDVQSAINAAGSTLPRNLPYPPLYSKVNPADTPIVTLALTSDAVSMRQLSDLADTLMAPRLSEISGVGRVSVQGGLRPGIRIQADLSRLAAYGIGLEDVRNAIVGANVAGPKGSLDGAQQSYTIAANDQIGNAAAYKSIVITYKNSAPVLLSDIANVVEGMENVKVGAWYQGKPAVVIDVQRQPGANVIDTVERIRAQLPRLQRALPAAARLTVVNDRTVTIRASIHDVQFTLMLSVVLVVLVVLIFLSTIRATIIAAVALPLSIIATFGVMWFCGFSLDNLSLMALTIGTGFVVDDAIVMIENIVRHMENGESPMEAALKGAREIGFTIISLTISLIAVLIPLLFMTDVVGRLFREFALTLTVAILISAVVSLTLTPMMCAKLLRKDDGQHGRAYRITEAVFDFVLRIYERMLRWVLRRRIIVGLITVATIATSVFLYIEIPKGLFPQQDVGMLMGFSEAPQDVSFPAMKARQERVLKALSEDKDVAHVVAFVGSGGGGNTGNTGTVFVELRSGKRPKADVIIGRLRGKLAQIEGVNLFLQATQDVRVGGRGSRTQYQYTLQDADLEELRFWGPKLLERLRKVPQIKDVNTDQQSAGLELGLEMDRDSASRLGITPRDLDAVLYNAFGQRQIATTYAAMNQYRVVLE